MGDEQIVAWIDHSPPDHYTAAYRAAVVPREPARREFSSLERARGWIESEAAFLQADVVWVQNGTGAG